jgi:hypothetical protein
MRSIDLVKDTRGTATAEGVIVAFFMAIVFGAVIFAYRGYGAAARSVRAVSAAVWPQAYAGCDDGPREHDIQRHLGHFEHHAYEIAPNEADKWDEIRAREISGSDTRSAGAGRMFDHRRTHFDEQGRTACNPATIDPPEIHEDVVALFCERHPDPLYPDPCGGPLGPGGE